MKIASFIAIVVFAMSSTSFAACSTRTKSSLFKNTAATTSNIAAAKSVAKVAYTQRAVQ